LGEATAINPAPAHAAHTTSASPAAAEAYGRMITAEQAGATILLLLPGFVALKIAYWVGIRVKRSEIEWILWSLLAAALIAAAVDYFRPTEDGVRVALSFAAAVILGIMLAMAWRLLLQIRPGLAWTVESRAWPVIASAEWVVIGLTDGRQVAGHPSRIADPVQADELDVYLTEVAWVEAGPKYVDIRGIDGMLIPESSISWAQVLTTSGELIDDPMQH
jgi:hypothetical protein